MISTVYVTLIYADASTWFAGGFQGIGEDASSALAAATAAAMSWLATEQTRPYWVNTTTYTIVQG